MEDNNEKKGEESTEENSGDGDKPKVPEAVRLARIENERMEEANRERRELITREEDLAAHKQLGGSAEGGKEPKKETEESDKDYRQRVEKEMAAGKTDFGN